MNNQITITRQKNNKEVKKILSSKKHTGAYLLDRYLTLVEKLDIAIPKNTMIL